MIDECRSCEGTGRQADGFSENTLQFSRGDLPCEWCSGTGSNTFEVGGFKIKPCADLNLANLTGATMSDRTNLD